MLISFVCFIDGAAVLLAKFCFEFLRRKRPREHAKRALGGSIMSLLARGRTAVRECDHIIPLLVGGAHGRFYAAVGQEACDSKGLEGINIRGRWSDAQ